MMMKLNVYPFLIENENCLKNLIKFGIKTEIIFKKYLIANQSTMRNEKKNQIVIKGISKQIFMIIKYLTKVFITFVDL